VANDAVDPRELHAAAAARLRAADQLYTTGRRELVELLASLGRPVTTYELLEARPKLTQSSVYRNLAVLEEMRVVQRVASNDDRARFELAEDLIGHHHHLVCTSCGRVDDFVVPTRSERTLDALLGRAIADTGFVPSGHRVDVIGTCAGCI
jgi:Fe2+ or Zn2+ uptake regulation protein